MYAERDIAGVPKERDTQGKTKQLPNCDLEIPRPFEIPPKKLLEPSQSSILNLPRSLRVEAQSPSKTLPKPLQNHPPNPPKSQKIVQEVPKRPKRCPRDVQERSRGAQGASKRRPRASRWRPRASQTLPKWSPGGYVFVFLSIFWAFISHLRSKSRFEAFFFSDFS